VKAPPPAATAPDLDADRRLLREAMAAAERVALKHFRARGGHWYKGPGQVLTEADLAVDRLLRGIVREARPDDAWLSEETPDDPARLGRERVWVVDPIDGTRAFADGVPEFAVSIALLVHDRPVLGMVSNPASGERFEAVLGGGAWQGGERLRVSGRSGLDGAHLLASRHEMKRRHWGGLFPEARFRSMGSLAYKLALIAAGRFDGLVSRRRTHDWDVAAADLLLAEAGGRLTSADGGPLVYNRPEPRHQGLVAAAPGLHGLLLARLRTG